MSNSQHIAIVGGSGSGKTWLAEKLCAELGAVAARLSLDDFYRDQSHLAPAARAAVNFDDPAAIDWAAARAVASALAQGEVAQVPSYDFATHTRRKAARPFAPRPLIIWDGLWLLHEPGLRENFSFSVFVDCDQAERLRRRSERDVRERGRTPESVRLQFLSLVQPMHEKFVQPQRTAADRTVASPIAPAELAGLVQQLAELAGRRSGLPQFAV